MADHDGPFGGFDPEAMSQIPLFRELSKLLSWQGGPVNWDMARQMAEGIAGEPQMAIGVDADSAAWGDAVRVAELWLDDHTGLPAVSGPAVALTSREWVQQATTSEGLGRYLEPVATGMQKALTKGLSGQLPEGMGLGELGLGGLGGIERAMTPMTAMLTGMQVGTIAGHLSTQLMGSFDLGVPTLDVRTVATVGDAASSFAVEYGFDAHEVRFWLALREALHRRLFAGIGWLDSYVQSLISDFAEAAEFDPSALTESLGGAGALDPTMLTDPEAMRRFAEQSGGIGLEPSAEQRRIMGKVQALVALAAGYVDAITTRAGAGKLSQLERIEEAAVRRRAEHGQGEQFLAQLMGIDFKPSDVRQGRAFCEAAIAARGIDGLDRVWGDSAYLPDPQDIADPSRWLVRMAAKEAADGVAPSTDDLPAADVEIPDDLGDLDL